MGFEGRCAIRTGKHDADPRAPEKWFLTPFPLYDNYGNSGEAMWLVEYVYWVEGGGGPPLGGKMPPPKSF
jgi:hypothetical protein